MGTSSASFLTFVVIVSLCQRSSGLPLPEQNSVVGNEAAPLEAEDDPARLRRYYSYGLRQTKLQGAAQLASNVHPQAAPFTDTAGTRQMSAMGVGTAQPNTGATGFYGEMRRTAKTNEVPNGGEGSSQTGGVVGFSDRTTNQYGPMQVGRDFSDTGRAVGSSEPGMAVPDAPSQTPQESRGVSLTGGINASSRVRLESPELADYASRESEASKDPGVGPPLPGAVVGSTTLAEAGVVRQAMPEPERQGAQEAYGAVGNTGGATLAQSNLVYNGENRPSLPSVARLDENGLPTVSQRSTASEASSGSRANGLYVEHGPNVYVGSGGQAAYA